VTEHFLRSNGMSVVPSPRDEIFAQFLHTLETSGVRDALAGLLKHTDYRYIGIFRFHNGMATAAVHFDREDPEALRIGEVPQNNTYCYFIKESRGVFTTPNSLQDSRLATHPACEAVQSYCGVPILDAAGDLLGSLCYYDVVPRAAEQVDMGLLMRVANTLAQRNQVPPYPHGLAAASAVADRSAAQHAPTGHRGRGDAGRP
jgi:GAF domain-containing protein